MLNKNQERELAFYSFTSEEEEWYDLVAFCHNCRHRFMTDSDYNPNFCPFCGFKLQMLNQK